MGQLNKNQVHVCDKWLHHSYNRSFNEHHTNQYKGAKQEESRSSVSIILQQWFSFYDKLRNCIAAGHQHTCKLQYEVHNVTAWSHYICYHTSQNNNFLRNCRAGQVLSLPVSTIHYFPFWKQNYKNATVRTKRYIVKTCSICHVLWNDEKLTEHSVGYTPSVRTVSL